MDTLVTKLVRGSVEIDRMKREISTVVHTILGSVYRSEWNTTEFAFTSADGKAAWYFNPYRDPAAGRVYFCLSHKATVDSAETQFMLYNDREGPSMVNVAIVHENLGVFVRGMLARFPVLQQRLFDPLLQAADAAEEN